MTAAGRGSPPATSRAWRWRELWPTLVGDPHFGCRGSVFLAERAERERDGNQRASLGSTLAPAQGRRMRSADDQRGHEVVVPGGGFALALEACLQCGVGASKVERDFAEQGQVPGCVALAYSARVFVEPDVEHPMQPVLDRPMASDVGGELCRW